MSNAEQASEPSMEDILASIRKIIAEEPDDADAPAAATPPSTVADTARLGRTTSSSEEASATRTAGEPVLPMPEMVQPTIEAVSDVPGPVAELADEDGDGAAADLHAGGKIIEAGQPTNDELDGDQATADEGAKNLSAFEALLAASTTPDENGNAAPLPPEAASTADGAQATGPSQGIDALLAAGSAETDGGASASYAEPQLKVPSLNDPALSSPRPDAAAADDSVDELMSLLDGGPSEPSPSQETPSTGAIPLPPLGDNAGGLAGLMARGDATGDASGAAPANEPRDERVEPILPMPVSAFEANVPKPAESLGPLLLRIEPDGALSAGPAAGTLPSIPSGDADAALVGQAIDADNLDVDQALDAAAVPASAANALSAGDIDAATANNAADDASDDAADNAASEPPLSTLLQNLGAAAEPVASPGSPVETTADEAADTADTGDTADSGAGASIATAAALGALAAGIAAADTKPAKVVAPKVGLQEDGVQEDAPQEDGVKEDALHEDAPATDAPAKTLDAPPPPSQIASLGALLASAPGSLTAQSELDQQAASADDVTPAGAGDDAGKETPPETGVAASEPGNELTTSQTQPARQQVLPSAVGDLVPGGVKTMEDTVTELLRPMLRDWLDSNMPRIVEKALRVELAATVETNADSDAGGGND